MIINALAMFLLLLLLLCLSYKLVSLYALFVCDCSIDIRNTAQAITINESTNEMKVMAILNWEKENIDGVYRKRFVPRFPFIVISRTGNPSWVYFSKYGTCGDFAVLFSEMATAVGIENRKVFCTGEDHEWVEVNINGSWKNADAAIAAKVVYNDTEFYERNWSQMSRVYYIDPDTKEEIDITNRYTDTGELIVRVNKDSESMRNVVVIVKSMYKCGNEQDPQEVIKANPNSNGTCVFNFGCNNYTVIAYEDVFAGLLGFKDEKIVRLEENSREEVILYPSEFTFNAHKILPFLRL